MKNGRPLSLLLVKAQLFLTEKLQFPYEQEEPLNQHMVQVVSIKVQSHFLVPKKNSLNQISLF